MFNTGNRVQLSDFASLVDSVVKNAEFFSVGKIPSRVPARLVPVGSAKFLRELKSNLGDIAAVICTPDLVDQIPDHIGCAVSKNPVTAAFHIHAALCAKVGHFWTDFQSIIAPEADIHPSAVIAKMNVRIGVGCFVGPNAVIQERSIIGERCWIGAGTVIGSEAFEISMIDGINRLQPHGGGVHIGNDVIFCSNSAVARSIYPTYTKIGDGCGFDNLVHVAHDCVLEAGCKLTACSMLSGRVDLMANTYLGPNSTVSNGLVLSENSVVTIGSTVVRNVDANTQVTGNFAVPHIQWIRFVKSITKDN